MKKANKKENVFPKRLYVTRDEMGFFAEEATATKDFVDVTRPVGLYELVEEGEFVTNVTWVTKKVVK